VSGALQLERLQTFPRIQTYDNTATPTGDEQHQQVKTAPVDLDALAAKIGEAVAEAEANDPKKLKARLAAAEAELAKRKHTAGVTGVDPGTMTKAITTARAEGRLEGRMEMGEAMRPVAVLMEQGAGHVHDAIRMFKAIKLPPIKMQPIFVAVDLAKPGSDRTVARIGTGEGDPTLKGGLRRILIALAQRPGLTRRQIGIRAGVASKGGSFNGHLAKGRAEGWITGSEKMEITDAGLAALGTYEPLPTGRALLDHWLEELGDSGAGKILRVATERYPEALSREAIGEAAGIAASGGSFNGHLSKLRGLELICGERGEIKASEELFQ
jgi:DNA-binding PadR family transcriptional regulator